MSELSGHVEDYLRLRRALGYKLERAGHLLPKLAAYLEAAGSPTLTVDLAISWARLPAHARPNHWAARLAVARSFARYMQTIEPATEVPPMGVFPARRHRPAPYLWSQHDIGRLLDGARTLLLRCGPPPTKRCSVCSPCQACASAKRLASTAKTSTSMPASSPSGTPSSTGRALCRCTKRPQPR